MNYQQHFAETLSQYLGQLKKELEDDMPRLNELVPEVTLGQADSYLEQTKGLVDTYHAMFHKESKGPRQGGSGVSYYQRQKQLRAYDEKIEAVLPSLFEKDGYVSATLIEQQSGVPQAEGAKRLQMMARKQGWRTRPDPENPEVVRYSMPRLRTQQRESAP
jgi:hypothetical protein